MEEYGIPKIMEKDEWVKERVEKFRSRTEEDLEKIKEIENDTLREALEKDTILSCEHFIRRMVDH